MEVISTLVVSMALILAFSTLVLTSHVPVRPYASLNASDAVHKVSIALYGNATFTTKLDADFKSCCEWITNVDGAQLATCSHTYLHNASKSEEFSTFKNTVLGNNEFYSTYQGCWSNNTDKSECCFVRGVPADCTKAFCTNEPSDVSIFDECSPYLMLINLCNAGQLDEPEPAPSPSSGSTAAVPMNDPFLDHTFQVCCRGQQTLPAEDSLFCNFPTYKLLNYALDLPGLPRDVAHEGEEMPPQESVRLCSYSGGNEEDLRQCCVNSNVGKKTNQSCNDLCTFSYDEKRNDTMKLLLFKNSGGLEDPQSAYNQHLRNLSDTCAADWPAIVDCYKLTLANGSAAQAPEAVAKRNGTGYGKAGVKTKKDSEFYHCCQRSSLIGPMESSGRQPICSYSVLLGDPADFPTTPIDNGIQASNVIVDPEPDDRQDERPYALFEDYLGCMSGFRDATDCCKNSDVPRPCWRLCDGERKDPISLVAFTSCNHYSPTIIGCHQGNAYPSAKD